MLTYAGIGSRSTPPHILDLMSAIAYTLARDGWKLRSGAADGADSAFESGALDGLGAVEIWLPWSRFNGHPSPLIPSPAAFEMAARFHPAWAACSRGARALHARNCHQVLGPDLTSPVSFVLCWTPSGSGSGGTGQALRIARAHSIPIFDLATCSESDFYARMPVA